MIYIGNPRLRDLHPALWAGTVCSALVHTSIGIAFLIVPAPASTAFLGPATAILPFHVWGVLSLALGLVGLSGVLLGVNMAERPRLLAAYHGGGVFMSLCWSLSEAIALIGGSLGLVAAPALWFWLMAGHYIMAVEPPHNPATAKRSQ